MKRLLVSTSSLWLSFFVLACSDSGSGGGAQQGNGGNSSSSSTSKGGQTGISTASSTGPVGGNTAAAGGNTAAAGGNTAAAGGNTAAAGGNTAAAGGNTAAKGGNTAAAGGNTAAKGGNTAIGGTANSNSSSSSSPGGMSTGGAGPKGGTNAIGGTSASTSLGGAATAGSSSTSQGGTPGGVTVQLDQTKQTIDGFGINNNWAPAMTDDVADALFDPTKGLGLTILRIGMGSNGSHFNSASPQDISKAKARGAKYIIGSTWSPPANCKDNSSENDGGHLLTSCYESWATTIAKFAKDNSLYAMSPGNEPDFASCGMTEPCNGNYPTTLYTAAETVAFIKVVGPKLQAAGVKVLAPEASEWLHNWSSESATGSEPGNKNSSDPLKCGFPASATKCPLGKGYDYGHALYADKAAWAALDIMGVHQYDTQVAEPWPADVPEKKPVWQTEMSGVKWWPEQGPSSDIKNGVAVAGWIHSALVIGEASAWLWWWYSQTGDNEGLMLGTTDTKRHYTFGNYTKFVRPGYVRVDVTGNNSADLLLSAYKGTDGTVVIVAINKGSATANVPIAISGGTAPASMTPNVTSASDNLKAGTAVTVTGGSFTATLASQTVTTFVGK